MSNRRSDPQQPSASDSWRKIVLENALDAVVGVTQDDIVVDWNHQAEVTFGWAKHEAIGRKMSEMIIPVEQREAHARGMRHFMQTGEGPILNRRIELEALHRSGNEFPVELTVMPIPVEGRYLFYSFIRDITDRRKIDDLLRESESQFRLITEAIPQLVWRTDLDGSADYFSRRFLKHVGYSAEKMLGWGWSEVIHPEDRSRVLEEWERCRAAEVPISIAFRVRGAMGEYRWFLARGNPFRDITGRLVKYYGTWTDIDDQKQIEAALRYQSQLTQKVTDNATSCLFIMDKQGYPTFMNPAAERLTGYKLEEIRGKPLHYAVHYKKPDGSHYPMEECPIDNAQAELVYLTEQEEIFVTKDGRLYPVSYSVAPLEENGQVVGSVLEFRDISEKKATEAALREAVSIRDEFLSIASHELKTPVTSLKLQFQLAQRQIRSGSDDVYSRERMDRMVYNANRQIDRITHLIEDMLDVSRIATGKLSMNKEEVDLVAVVKEALERTDEQMEAAGIAVERYFLCDRAVVSGDHYRLDQVVDNLLNNALKYGRKRPVSVTVRVAPEADTVQLVVQDQGIGIAPENLKRIFNRFERAVGASEVSGLGLGLYITNQIVEAHQGAIRVESEIGTGTTFTVDLPLEERA